MGIFDLGRWIFGGTYDPTQDWITQYNGGNRDLNYERSDAFYNLLTQNGSSGNPMSWLNSAQNMSGQQNALLSALTSSANRSGADMFNQFSEFQPGMMTMAGNVADQAMQYNGQQIEDYANMRSRDSMRSLENTLGGSGLFSTSNGAALAAMARGAQTPIMEAMTNLGNMRSQAYMNAYTPMANTGYQSVVGQTDALASALNGVNNAMGVNGNIGGNLMSLLGSQSESAWLTPQMVEQNGLLQSLLGAGVSGLTRALGGI